MTVIESPIANDSITNKQATGKASIYHTCRSVLNALTFIQGFEKYFDRQENDGLPESNDPLTNLWHICRQGSSLCYLYNTLQPEQPIQIDNTKNSSAANKSKALVYHFIIACRDQLKFAEETLFTLSDLYQNDTNGFVKVVNTVKRILDLLEENGTISVKSITESSLTKDSPKDMRDNVVFEMVSTERKYVQDLEGLQDYMREVQAQSILSLDTMHNLFGNLNALVDFQRRFLIQIEDQASKSVQEQRFGSLFIQFEEAFSVYEPFCANFQIAQDLVIQESHKLQKLAHIMSPTYELPAMLIKPIQRVCKYPLLMQQLIKSTPDDWPYSPENKEGLEAITRVTKNVNETKRIQENLLVVQDLKKRIADDSVPSSTTVSALVDSFGTLLLHDKFTLQRHDSDQSREMTVFLFDKTILICKEIKDVSKNSLTLVRRRKEGSLVVRGKIPMSKIDIAKGSSSQNGHYTMHISWMEMDLQTILLRCRNDEQLKQWLEIIVSLLKLKKPSTAGVRLDLISAPQTPRMEQNNPLLHYDEDEEDYYGGHEEENEEVAFRNRLYSHQYQSNSPRGYEVSSRKASLPSSQHNTSTRHFLNNVPGMNFPPLPRSPTTPLHSNGMDSFPSSPPGSHPSSPTTATPLRSANGISPSGALWQRRQQIEQDKEEQQMRARSQSSPNIQRPALAQYNTTPDLPTTTFPINSDLSKRRSNGHRYELSTTVEEITKVKVHYFGAIYVVVVPTDIEYTELQKRIESKIKLCGQEFENFGLKYEDEDGDLITISSSEDVQMGFENKGPNNAVNLYVT